MSETSLNQYLPPGLRYACRHWTSHAEYGRLSLFDNGPVYDFLRQFCLYWIEIMGLIRKIICHNASERDKRGLCAQETIEIR